VDINIITFNSNSHYLLSELLLATCKYSFSFLRNMEQFDSMDLRSYLSKALCALNREDMLGSYLEYLKSEWIYSINDLKLAIDDGQAWSDIKLPVRLKIELKKIIIGQNELLLDNLEDNVTSFLNMEDCKDDEEIQRATWVKCFSRLDNFPYYYNIENGHTQWEEPKNESWVTEEIYYSELNKRPHKLSIAQNGLTDHMDAEPNELPIPPSTHASCPNPEHSVESIDVANAPWRAITAGIIISTAPENETIKSTELLSSNISPSRTCPVTPARATQLGPSSNSDASDLETSTLDLRNPTI